MQQCDLGTRDIGHVHHSPPISVDANGERFTEDWGTIELLEEKFKTEYKGNILDLGAHLSPINLA